MNRWIAALTFSLAVSASATAAPIYWTDWQGAGTNTVTGELNIGGETVGVTYSGPYAFAQTAGGTNYWTEPNALSLPYTGSALVDNAPPASDIIALNTGGLKTITFSQAVVDPLIALVSWNDNVVDFGVPIDILSYGDGFWGSGIPVMNDSGTGFLGWGEVHGVIRLAGTFTSISFTDTTEFWHGFTLGVVGLADDNGGDNGGDNGSIAVPEPGSLALIGAGLLGFWGLRRRRKD